MAARTVPRLQLLDFLPVYLIGPDRDDPCPVLGLSQTGPQVGVRLPATIRPDQPSDCSSIAALVLELACHEHLEQEALRTEDNVRRMLFNRQPYRLAERPRS
jgi:hypothetical protein